MVGPRVKTTPFWAFGTGPSAKNVGNPMESEKNNNALGQIDRFWTVLGPVDGQIVPKKGDHVLTHFPMFLVFLHFLTTF